MGLTASDSGGGNYVQAPPGVHPAICYSVVDLGTQEKTWEGKTWDSHQVFISWELPTQMFEFDGVTKPIAMSGFYTVSLHEKANLRIMLEGWRSKGFSSEELKGFNIKDILEKPCLMNVIEKDGKAKIGSVMPADDGAKSFTQFNDTLYFSFEEGLEIPGNIPEGIKNIIRKAKEFDEGTDWDAMRKGEPAIHGEDNIPF